MWVYGFILRDKDMEMMSQKASKGNGREGHQKTVKTHVYIGYLDG